MRMLDLSPLKKINKGDTIMAIFKRRLVNFNFSLIINFANNKNIKILTT